MEEQDCERDRLGEKQVTKMKQVHLGRTVTGSDRKHAPTTTPSPAKCKSVFFESYTDSPEFTYIENLVVHMEEELLPGEQGNSPAPPMPHPRSGRQRQHPLSQVSYPESSVSPEDTRRVLPVEAQVYESSLDKVDKSTLLTERHPAVMEKEKSVIVISDDEDEEMGDDTFDFLLG